jgi:2'-hydroxyisoflavone reductase
VRLPQHFCLLNDGPTSKPGEDRCRGVTYPLLFGLRKPGEMRLLILGGTIFLGRHLVEAALARGHQVTVFNRGRHYPTAFPQVERLQGDRRGDLEVLQGRSWDAVVDTSGHVPRVVEKSARLLAGAVGHYTFISSVFAYKGFPREPGLDENSPLNLTADAAAEHVTPETLGPLKAFCERVLDAEVPGRALIVRAGFIFGPYDPTHRSGYWVHRVAQGGEVLAPGDPNRQLQIVDVRDLAEWILTCIVSRRTGVYNGTGPAYPSPLTLGRLLQVCQTEGSSDARSTWVSDEFLRAAGVRPGIDLPFWMPGGVAGVNCNKAIGAGLTFRPLEHTIRDTFGWYNVSRSSAQLRSGITRDHESQLLRTWHTESRANDTSK